MTNPTSNFGWQMPTSTDLVTDLPADFEVFGQAVDTALADLKGGTTGQVLAKASNTDMDFVWSADASGIPASAFAAKGNILVGTGASTYTAQAVGANGTVLTADSAEADGVKWATPTPPAENWTLLNAGGTTLAGVKDVTVSGISGQNQLMIIFMNLSSSTARAYFNIDLNSSTTNYTVPTGEMEYPTAYATTNLTNGNDGRIRLAKMGATVNSAPVFGYLHVSGCNSSGVKTFMGASGATNSGTSDAAAIHLGGIWNDAATISSVRIQTSATQMSNGFTGTARIFVYGRA